jgi:FkbM family methyltransferase
MNTSTKFISAITPHGIKSFIKSVIYSPYMPRYRRAPLRFGRGIVMDLVPLDVISESIAEQGTWETELTRRLIDISAEGNATMVEVGANMGYFSLIWAGNAPGNRVFAFEPSLPNVTRLLRNIKLNRLEDQIHVLPVAVGRQVGLSHFELGPITQTGQGGLCNHDVESSLTVVVVTLDQLFCDGSTIDCLKIDVEGADTWVLMGAERLLRSRLIRYIAYEQNKERMERLGIRLGEAEKWLESVGYETFPLNDSSGETVEWFATPAS